MSDITEERLRIIVDAEVDKAIKNMGNLDKKTKSTSDEFKLLGKTISDAFVLKKLLEFGKQSVKAYENDKQAIDILNSTIQATGANAWTSSKDLQEMAASFQNITNYSEGTIEAMQSVLLGFKNIKGDNFKKATTAILDMATVMKMDLSSAAQTVGKALDDPINGLDSLKRQGFNFTDAQKSMIKAMLDVGDAAGAQKLILDELESTYGGAAEAAQSLTAKIQNSWNDLLSGYGAVMDGFEKRLPVLTALADAFEFVGNAGKKFWDNVAEVKARDSGGDVYKNWYDSLDDKGKIEETTVQLKQWENQLKQAQDELKALDGYEGGTVEKDKDNWKEIIDKSIQNIDGLRRQKALLEDSVKSQQEMLELENERKAAESAINDLILSIGTEYAKLGKDDPVIQMQNYQKELEKVAKERKQLKSAPVTIDTKDAEKQLNYIEKSIKQKMAALRAGEKQSWQHWLASILKVDEKSFKTGKEAAEKYIKGMGDAVESSNELKQIFGKDFDIASYIGNQADDVKNALTQLLSIDPETIDEAFKTGDDAIDELIAKWRSLKKEQGEALGSQKIEELQKSIDDYGKSEKQLALDTLKAEGATADQLVQVGQLYDQLEKLESQSSWQNAMSYGLDEAMEKWGKFDEKTSKVLTDLTVNLASVSFDAMLSGLESLGEAWGQGKDASESLQAALAETAQSVLDSLPNLFLEAGLQLLAEGNPLGWGLIASAAVSGIVSGYVKGALDTEQDDTTANALGGAYDQNGRIAFAKGGTFTNAIVQSPTFFKFANGSGFSNGVMGEAEPEAIMPLKRGVDGSLGVSLYDATAANESISESVVLVNIYSTEKVTQEETTNADGSKQVDIFVGVVNKAAAAGKFDKTFGARYGLKARGV